MQRYMQRVYHTNGCDITGMRAASSAYGRILPNRSVRHAEWLVQRAHGILANAVVAAEAEARTGFRA
jgi:hypothetical protein